MVVPFAPGARREHTDSMPVITLKPANGAEPAHAPRAEDDEDFEEPGPATIGSSLDDVSFCEHSLLVRVSSHLELTLASRPSSPACAIRGRLRQTSGALQSLW